MARMVPALRPVVAASASPRATASELAESAALVADVLESSLRKDVLATLARDLSQTHDLQMRLGGVQQILIGTQQ